MGDEHAKVDGTRPERASCTRTGDLHSLRQEGRGMVLCSRVICSQVVILAAQLWDKFAGHKTGGRETIWEAISSRGYS